ncbi:MAG: hypothetical protein NT023_21365, partial [Armatimonadetes bacterium]|nr:hypothetical protein [Armatimonadota bacterium]
MMLRLGKFGVAALAFGVLGFATTATPVLAQDAGDAQETLNNKPVNLDLEGVDLYQALTLLFKQAKAQYSLDNNLRGTLVTVHIKQPFKNALEAVLKASGLPITYQFTDGVYNVVPIKEDIIDPATDPKTDEPTTAKPRLSRIFATTLNGVNIASYLGGKFLSFTSAYSGFMGFNPLGGGGGG